MKILDYPRPDGDTGIGFHWFPDVYHYSDEIYGTFMPRLKSLGVSWLTILSEPDKPIPSFFIKGLIEQGIEPVIRVYTPSVRPLEQSTLGALCETYARWGVHYIHVFNEPNLEVEWETWDPENLPEIFMGHLLPCLETMYAVDGIVPVLTPAIAGRQLPRHRVLPDHARSDRRIREESSVQQTGGWHSQLRSEPSAGMGPGRTRGVALCGAVEYAGGLPG